MLGLARGRDGVGRVVGAAAAGVGRRVADRPDTVRGAAHIVIACQSAGGVGQIHAGGQTGFCKNRVGISALAASALDDVVCPVVLDLRARIKAERAAGDGDGLAARAAALLNFAIERAIFDIDNSCCVSCSISANNTGKCTVLNVDRTAGVVNIGSIRSGIGAALYSGGAAILNSHRTIQVRAISSSDIRNFDLAIFQCCIASNLHAAAVFCGQLHVGERCGLGFKSSAQECIDTSDVIGAAGDNDLTAAGSLHNALVRLGADIVQDQLALTAHRKQCSVVIAVACAGAAGIRSTVNSYRRTSRTLAKVNKAPHFCLPVGIMRISHRHTAPCGRAVDGQIYLFSSDPNRAVFYGSC